jgi:hypothetical protein
MSMDLVELEKGIKVAEVFAKSKLVPWTLQNKPQDILVLFQQAKELNIPPMQALNGINVIQGKPTISPQLMLALIYQRIKNPSIVIEPYDKERKSVTVKMKRDKNDDDSETKTSEFGEKEAKSMNLMSRDNYKKQPETMMKWRAVSACARECFPDVIMGLYMPDELEQDGQVIYNEDGTTDYKEPLPIQPLEVKDVPQKINFVKELYLYCANKLKGDVDKIKAVFEELKIKKTDNITEQQYNDAVAYVDSL